MEIHERNLPVLPEVNGACELLGLDPLHVANEGIFIAIVAPEYADEAIGILRNDEYGIHAAIIGQVLEKQPPQVVYQSLIGGRHVVPMLPGEQLPRIC
jgi:hydrogenase expression/formation protein HypE